MIPVNELFETIQDLARKEQKGYQSDEEFSRKLKANELRLLGYFWEHYERTQEITDHVGPFVKNAPLPVEDGVMAKPDDYAHRIRVGAVVINNVCDGQPTTKRLVTEYIRAANVNVIENGSITKPSLDDELLYHYFEDNGVKFLPRTGIDKVEMTYLRYPVYGRFVQSATVSGAGEDVFAFDAAASQDLEWPAISFPYIQALMLRSLGMEIEDPGLMNYGQALFTELERRDNDRP